MDIADNADPWQRHTWPVHQAGPLVTAHIACKTRCGRSVNFGLSVQNASVFSISSDSSIWDSWDSCQIVQSCDEWKAMKVLVTRVAGCQCRARPGVQFIDWIKTVLTASWTSAFYVLLPYLAIKLCEAFHKFSANIQRFESERQNQSQYNPKSKHICWKRRQKRAAT